MFSSAKAQGPLQITRVRTTRRNTALFTNFLGECLTASDAALGRPATATQLRLASCKSAPGARVEGELGIGALVRVSEYGGAGGDKESNYCRVVDHGVWRLGGAWELLM